MHNAYSVQSGGTFAEHNAQLAVAQTDGATTKGKGKSIKEQSIIGKDKTKGMHNEKSRNSRQKEEGNRRIKTSEKHTGRVRLGDTLNVIVVSSMSDIRIVDTTARQGRKRLGDGDCRKLFRRLGLQHERLWTTKARQTGPVCVNTTKQAQHAAMHEKAEKQTHACSTTSTDFWLRSTPKWAKVNCINRTGMRAASTLRYNMLRPTCAKLVIATAAHNCVSKQSDLSQTRSLNFPWSNQLLS